MVPDYARLASAIVAARRARGWNQKQFVTESGLGNSTVQRLERGSADSPYPTRRTIETLEQALGWAPDSVAEVLRGGEPTPVSASVNGRAPNVTGGVTVGADEALEMRGLPAGIRAALSEGEHLAGDVIDLSEPGSGIVLVVIAQRGLVKTPEDVETLRKQMKEWMRIQAGIRRLVEHPENTQANDGE